MRTFKAPTAVRALYSIVHINLPGQTSYYCPVILLCPGLGEKGMDDNRRITATVLGLSRDVLNNWISRFVKFVEKRLILCRH